MTEAQDRLPRALRPFRTVPYRVLAGALALSLLGAGIWVVALVGQVLAMGGTPLELSAVATGSAVGMLLAVLFGGVAADRVPQKRILVGVELTKVVVAAAVAALALTGSLQIWQLTAAAVVLGVAEGFFYPAYSALLPTILPAGDLLAANGIEGMLRPSLVNAAGPALAAIVIAAASPGPAFVFVAALQACALVGLLALRATPLLREEQPGGGAIAGFFADIRGGFAYMFRTRWLLATLLFACLQILFMMGPIEVLLPFAVRDQVAPEVQAAFGGTEGAFAFTLAAFGIGGAVGSLLMASLRLPRRYLSVIMGLWALGGLPLVVIGLTGSLSLIVAAVFLSGFLFSASTVLWGTLLQRRVPSALLGRVSSLDFFVSLTLMPVSMAIAGPIGVQFGLPVVFVVAGVVPFVLAVVTVFAARLPHDEIAHPLDPSPPAEEAATEAS